MLNKSPSIYDLILPLFFRLLCFGLLSFSLSAFAQESIVLNGFATIGVSCFSDSNADFAYNTLPNGPGRTHSCDMGLDSVFGLQADAKLSNTLDGVLQVTSQRTAYNNYNPGLSLGHLKWQANDALMLRLGRVSNPLFLYSDYRLVHFSLPFLRPPSEVYDLSPSYTMDGMDATDHYLLHDWKIEHYAGYQSNDIATPLSNSPEVDMVKLREVLTLTTSAESGSWFFKIGYSQGKASYNTSATDALFNTLISIDPTIPGAAALAGQLDMLNAPFHVYTFSARYDDSNWLLITEIAKQTFDKSFFRDNNAGYVTAAFHLDTWMPYATLARRNSYGQDSYSLVSQLPATLAQSVTTLLASTLNNQSSFTLGVSREMGAKAVIRGQVEWLQPDRGNSGTSLANVSPNYNLANPPLDQLISINLSFIF